MQEIQIFFQIGNCGEWLLVNEKSMLMVSLDENQPEAGHINSL